MTIKNQNTWVLAFDTSTKNANGMDAQLKWKMTFNIAKHQAEQNIRLSPFTISIFNSKTHANFSTKNKMTTWYTGKCKTDVLCLHKHKLSHDEILIKECFERNTLVTISGIKNSINKPIESTGLVLSPRAMCNSVSIDKINVRIVMLTLEGSSQTFTVCCYHPTNGSFQEDMEPFYNHVNAALSNILAHNIVLVAGDFNVKIKRR